MSDQERAKRAQVTTPETVSNIDNEIVWTFTYSAFIILEKICLKGGKESSMNSNGCGHPEHREILLT